MTEPLLNNMTVSTVQSYLRRERARGRLSEDEIRRLDATGRNKRELVIFILGRISPYLLMSVFVLCGIQQRTAMRI